jgi:hypothetical protein
VTETSISWGHSDGFIVINEIISVTVTVRAALVANDNFTGHGDRVLAAFTSEIRKMLNESFG